MTRYASLALALSLVSIGCGPTPDPTDGGDGTTCRAAADCSDGTFCNGAESCDPEHPTADSRGCVAGAPPCGARACDEATAMCTEGCSEADRDRDGDGVASIACGGDDCDDNQPNRFPGNPEVCDPDGLDEDCDPTTLGPDADGDGLVGTECCNVTAGGIRCGADCDDTQSSVNPGGTEVCNGVDEDCDGFLDEGVFEIAYPDVDGDGFGSNGAGRERECDGNPLFASQDGDCDDSNAAVNPSAAEICDGLDNDCDGDAGDEVDIDGDGFLDARSTCTDPMAFDCDDLNPTAFPGAPEQCNDVDDNCDGLLDERVGSMPGFGADDFCSARIGDGAGFCANRGAAHECVISSCPADRDDCDGNANNGCEADLATDPANCGGCGIVCAEECVDGLCGAPRMGRVLDLDLGRRGGCILREVGAGSGQGRVDCWGEIWFIPFPARPTAIEDSAGVLITDVSKLAASRRGLYILRGTTLWTISEDTQLGAVGPTPVEGLPTGVTDVASRSGRVCALVGDGDLWCWDDGSSPTHLFAGEQFASISVGERHSCALRDNGLLVCFGSNDNGQLGIAPTGDETRIEVFPGVGGYSSVAAGYRHTCGVRPGQGVFCWGEFEDNPGSTAAAASPILTGAIEDLSAGERFSCARVGGEVQCWGFQRYGTGIGLSCENEIVDRSDVRDTCDNLEPAGRETTCSADVCTAPVNSARPVRLTEIGFDPEGGSEAPRLDELADATLVDVHEGRACAVRADQTLVCWGDNREQGLATGGPQTHFLAAPQRSSATVARTALSERGGCAQLGDGAMRCWGSNIQGVLGPIGAHRHLAPRDSGLGLTDVRGLSLGQGVGCAVRLGGTVECWGGVGSTGEVVPLGDGSAFDQGSATPVAVTGLTGVVDVSVGFDHVCALTDAGAVHCWGSNSQDQLGVSPPSDCGGSPCALTPIEVPLPAAATQVVTGGLRVGDAEDGVSLGAFSCARLVDGRVVCWGQSAIGALGSGHLDPVPTPTLVDPSVVGETIDLAASASHVCALQASGVVWCWGGVLGPISGGADICGLGIPCRAEPFRVPILVDAVDIEVGLGLSCALRPGGAVTCWGTNQAGEVGDGSIAPRDVPSTIVPLPSGARSIQMRASTSCATLATNEVYCWGGDDRGERGDGVHHRPASTFNHLLPTQTIGL